MDAEQTPLPDAVERFIELHDMPPATFGRLAMKDPHFVRDLRSGRRLWPETEDKLRTFMREYRAPAEQAQAA